MKMIVPVFTVFLLLNIAEARLPQAAPKPVGKKWQTLNGLEPVLATTGVSGLFPEGTDYGFNFDRTVSYLANTLYYCDMQLTKDGIPFCLSSVTLDNSTNIKNKIPDGKRTYKLNGRDIEGWFSLDFTSFQLFEDTNSPISLVQSQFSRTSFVDEMYGLSPLDTTDKAMDDASYWINVENDLFYKEHKINTEPAILSFIEVKPIVYLSSPQVNFLKGIAPKLLHRPETKLILKFQPSLELIEPTTNEPYGSWLKKLAEIKLFAAGILVPKEFIWPVGKDGYLLPATTLVSDAHKLGLEVHVYGLRNDATLSFNYSYDPVREYLNYIDNQQFSVDGIVTEFPVTASESIQCFAHEKDHSRKVQISVISHNGASGDFPGSTDLAYDKAINDGADIIDCSVQLSKDGVAFCMESADLTFPTNAAEAFMEKSTIIPEMGPSNGVYSFDLTWTEIQSLKPQLRSSYDDKQLPRNPLNKNAGKFVTLAEFLNLVKTRKVPGVMITVNNVPYLASKRGMDMIKTVSTALAEAGLNKHPTQVLIQSDDSSVLGHFKEIEPSYQRVYEIQKDLLGLNPDVPAEIKKFADAITVQRNAIVLNYDMPLFLSANYTNIVTAMHAANVSVYVGVFKNEFTNLLFDYYADPYIELATHDNAKVDGFITDFPSTAAAYMRSWCARANNNYNITGINSGDVFTEMKSFRDELKLDAEEAKKTMVPPISAPILTKENVTAPPLPPVAIITTPAPAEAPAPEGVAAPSDIYVSAAYYVDGGSSKATLLLSMIVGAIYLLNVMEN